MTTWNRLQELKGKDKLLDHKLEIILFLSFKLSFALSQLVQDVGTFIIYVSIILNCIIWCFFFFFSKCFKVLPATLYTNVTDHIPQIIEFIKQIIDNGFAYTSQSGKWKHVFNQFLFLDKVTIMYKIFSIPHTCRFKFILSYYQTEMKPFLSAPFFYTRRSSVDW